MCPLFGGAFWFQECNGRPRLRLPAAKGPPHCGKNVPRVREKHSSVLMSVGIKHFYIIKQRLIAKLVCSYLTY